MTYACGSCGKEWDYPLGSCIFCGGLISKEEINKYTIHEITQVFVPSSDHPVTPYYVMLLKDENGSYKFQKTFLRQEIGETICCKGNLDEKSVIGVVGTGVTSRGIVEIAAKTGHKVIVKSRSDKSLEKALNLISKNLSKGSSPDDSQKILSNITTTTNYDALSEANFVIESVVEDMQVKKDIFNVLDTKCGDDVILASNTSSLSISRIAKDLIHPERVVGMHFFNPIQKMQLVEIITGEMTSGGTLRCCQRLARKLNKVSVVAKDTPGFIVNRLLFRMIEEACQMLAEDVAKIEDIDKAMKLGANYPMGPFELADLIGLDLCLEIIENLKQAFGDCKIQKGSVLQNLVMEGHLGRKTGSGFYEYKISK